MSPSRKCENQLIKISFSTLADYELGEYSSEDGDLKINLSAMREVVGLTSDWP